MCNLSIWINEENFGHLVSPLLRFSCFKVESVFLFFSYPLWVRGRKLEMYNLLCKHTHAHTDVGYVQAQNPTSSNFYQLCDDDNDATNAIANRGLFLFSVFFNRNLALFLALPFWRRCHLITQLAWLAVAFLFVQIFATIVDCFVPCAS